jgi:hypothetical protein
VQYGNSSKASTANEIDPMNISVGVYPIRARCHCSWLDNKGEPKFCCDDMTGGLTWKCDVVILFLAEVPHSAAQHLQESCHSRALHVARAGPD